MTDQACGRIGLRTVSRCADKAADALCGLLPYPPAPRERHKHHEPVVHVPEAGSSLAWMAIGATGIVGLFVMKKPRA